MINFEILILDNEKILLDVLYQTFKDQYNIYIAKNSEEANLLLEKQEIDVLMVDYNTISSKLDYIFKVKSKKPDISCILLVNQPTNKILSECIFHEEIFCFHSKPLNLFDLHYSIEKAKKYTRLKKENQKLVEQLNFAKIKTKQAENLKNSILSNISHEIRTPLNSILGFTSLISSRSIEKERVNYFKQIIINSSNQLLKTVDDLLTIAKIDAGIVNSEKKIFDLCDFFNAIFNTYKQKAIEKNIFLELKGINLDKEFFVETDKTKLFEILKQLLDNALKFTKSGFISFGIYDLEKCVFFIKDSGIGIEENKLYEIFEMFHQESSELNSRNYGGTGLGLSIVKAYLKSVNGQIWLKSKKYEGTTLYFKFPFTKVQDEKLNEINAKAMQ